MDSKIYGRAVIGSGCVITNSIVKGPCITGNNCKISSTYIGPYTSINDECTIDGTEIEDSVIMSGSTITNAGRILESLVGKNVKIRAIRNKSLGNRFVVGDNSDIAL